MLPIYFWLCVHLLEHVRLTRNHTLKKLPLSLSGEHLPVAPQLEVGFSVLCPSPCWAFVWFDPAPVLCMLSKTSVWMWNCPIVPTHRFLRVAHHLSYNLSLSYPQWSLSSVGGGRVQYRCSIQGCALWSHLFSAPWLVWVSVSLCPSPPTERRSFSDEVWGIHQSVGIVDAP